MYTAFDPRWNATGQTGSNALMRRTMVLTAIALLAAALNAHGQIVTPVFSRRPARVEAA
jgi:hypothetical protein